MYADADDLERRSEVEVKPEGTLLQVKELLQEKKKPVVKTCDPLASGWSPESKPPLANAASPRTSNVETIQRVIEFQERQANCMEGLVTQQHQSA